MTNNRINHIFGPVPSRRLGRSLGVDLVPYKICSFDCIYCQLGRTTKKCMEIKEYFPLDEILDDIRKKLKEEPRIDYITLSGSGEPTLYSRTKELISRIKAITQKPIAVLTNGSLLWKEDVRKSIMGADVVIPSLDAGNEEMFQYINRPCKDLTLELIVSGIKSFISEYKGETWLEVFLLKGPSSELKHISELSKLINYLKPTRTQLNTIARPPSEKYAEGLSSGEVRALCNYFPDTVESICEFKESEETKNFAASKEDVLNLLMRRPCTISDVSESLSANKNEVIKVLQALSSDGKIECSEIDNKNYYKVKKVKPL